MKILHTVESYYPAIGGMQEVVKQLSERLVKLGHHVTVATSKHTERNFHQLNGVEIKEFSVKGNSVLGFEGNPATYKDYLLQSDFDVMTFFAAQQWACDIALPILDKLKSKKVFVPTGFSGFYNPVYKEYFEKMKTWMKKFDMNIFLSDNYRDINFAKENGVTKTILIPNGAALDEFLTENKIDIRKNFKIGKNDFLILHVGSYTTHKGHNEAVEIFLRSKIKNATLLMIGNRYEDFQKQYYRKPLLGLLKCSKLFSSKKIIFTYIPRDETVAAYLAADLFLFPSFIECSPIVLFEAMASQTPFLVTDVGNSSEIVRWSNGGLVLPTVIDEQGMSHAKISESVEMLNDLCKQREKLKHLADAGFEAWQKNYTWEIISKKYESLYENLLTQTL